MGKITPFPGKKKEFEQTLSQSLFTQLELKKQEAIQSALFQASCLQQQIVAPYDDYLEELATQVKMFGCPKWKKNLKDFMEEGDINFLTDFFTNFEPEQEESTNLYKLKELFEQYAKIRSDILTYLNQPDESR